MKGNMMSILRRIVVSVTLLLMAVQGMDAAHIVVKNLRTENRVCPLGLQTTTPRFSWQTEADVNDVQQTGYRILVASTPDKLAQGIGDLWDSWGVASDKQQWIDYEGKPLKDNQRAYWKVKVYTNRGESEDIPTLRPDSFGIGLLGETHWGGRWIGLEQLMPDEHGGLHSRLAARYLKQVFELKKTVRRATAYIAAVGWYKLYVNGVAMNTHALSPVPSDYRKTVYYNAYDVTEAIGQRQCAVDIILGNGRAYNMRQDKPYKNTTFGLPKCRLNIIVEYADGTTERLTTDEKWQVRTDGPIRANNEYDGEIYDSRLCGIEDLSHRTSPLAPLAWQQAHRTALPEGELRGQPMAQVTARPLTNAKVTVVMTADKRTTVDIGQNTAGWIAFTPRGNWGDTIRVRYAERLNSDGTLFTDNLRTAQQEDIYVCNGQESGRWMPTFVYHGFRYVEITGTTPPEANDIEVWTVSDEMQQTGTFRCSDEMLNSVFENAVRGIRSNYKGMPIDCPQRDERQPWLGDRTASSLGESYVFDNERLYTKWMRDICEAQRHDGCIPDVAPAFWNYFTDDVTWPAALPFTCDMLLRQYGNIEPVRESYPHIRRWLHHIMAEYSNKDGLITKDKYGDWCAVNQNDNAADKEEPTFYASAYAVGALRMAEKFARVLGLEDDEKEWKAKRATLTEAFNRQFLKVRRATSLRPGHVLYPDSVLYGNNTATGNVLALAFGIVPDSCRDDVVRQVVRNIVKVNGEHGALGVLGMSWLMRTLSDHGYADVAWRLATQTTFPSWGYMVEQGATTIWELWNGNTAGPTMNSANHVMLLGDLITWCFEYVGGIRSDDGYRHITLCPRFDIADCSEADVSYESPYGRIVSRWKKTGRKVTWDVEIPVNCSGKWIMKDLRDAEDEKLTSGQHHFEFELPEQTVFVYDKAAFPECHASTITEVDNGRLVAAWFGGTKEKNPDCNIYVSRKEKNSNEWTAPQLVADGNGTACWNPVLFTMPNGEVWLFYKVGKSVPEWTGWLVRSTDGGVTWSAPEQLPDGMLGPVKNKPLVRNGRLICGSSTETKDKIWRVHFEILDLLTGKWKKVEPPHPDDSLRMIQPTLLVCGDTLRALCRTRNSWLAMTESTDDGESWSMPVLTSIPSNGSGIDAVTLHNGTHAMVYTPFASLKGIPHGERTPLCLAHSKDGLHWQPVRTLESSALGEYSYPAIIEGKDGALHTVYTWRRKRIAYFTTFLPPTM